jgi:predicted RND superfamily exporter protein
MLLVLPAILALFERSGLLRLQSDSDRIRVRSDDRPLAGTRLVLVGSVAAVVAALVFLPRVSFEYRMGTLEPSYDEYNVRQDVVRRVFSNGGKRNPAYIVVDNPDEVPPIVDALRAKMEADSTSPTIAEVESLQERFPMDKQAQEDRLWRLADIRDQLADPFLEADTTADMKRLRRAASTTEPIALDELPEFLRKQFTSKNGQIGNFVMIYPSVGLSDGRNSIAFSDDVGTVTTADGKVYHAGSTSLVAADMLRLMQRESPWMVLATLAIVCILMYANFRSLRWMLLALLPLVVGILWMLLLMEVFDLKLNFYNLIVLPAVLGIGNDAGVHLVHRYREEGKGSMRRIVRSTGEHVTMGSVTTMVGFAGLLLSFHPGLNTIGELAVVGIGATLLAALFFLPALIQWLEEREAV